VVAEQLDDVPGELGALVDLCGAGRDAPAREVAHEVADLPLLVAERIDRHEAKCMRRITDAGSARRLIRGAIAHATLHETKGAPMTRSLTVLVVAGASLLLAATASPQTGTTLTIRHQLHGCHTWSVDSGAYKASQTVTLTKGATLTVVNND